MLLVTAEEMRALDREVIDKVGVPGAVLMESAGRGVVEVIATMLPLDGARIAVFAGPGNNGGDGFVVARHLAGRGAEVEVVLLSPREKVRGDARLHLEAAERSGVGILDGSDGESLAVAAAETAEADLVVDALLGTGLERAIEGLMAEAVELINRHPSPVVSVDIPSGLHADRGVPLGTCVTADHTVTFAFPKRGMVGAPGFTHVGTLHVADIGIPERLARARGITATLLDDTALDPLHDRMDPLGHKGTHGHLLVVAGSRGKTGAAQLSGTAALRAGAGLVTVASPPDAQRVLDGRVAELMTASYGAEGGALSAADALAALEPLVDGKKALACGPGIPTDPAMREVLRGLLKAAAAHNLPAVLDADALNHLAEEPKIVDGARLLVLTPHPGEAARLLGRDTREVQADRVRAAIDLTKRFGAVVALKGARTVISAPDGRLAICPTGNAAMGTAGTGDVLTGIVGAFLARGLDPFDATSAAVYAHGAAGDRVTRTQPFLVAHDVIDALPHAMEEIRASHTIAPPI